MPFKSAIAEITDPDRPESSAHGPPPFPSDGLTADLRRFIQAAVDWQDLGRIMDAVDAAYRQGKLGKAAAEELAQLAREVSRGIPEDQPGQDPPMEGWRVWADDLLPDVPDGGDMCGCCGRTHWWTKASGERVCGVCHPEPREGWVEPKKEDEHIQAHGSGGQK